MGSIVDFIDLAVIFFVVIFCYSDAVKIANDTSSICLKAPLLDQKDRSLHQR